MRRLLITGGAGFIGSNFVHYWRVIHPGDRLVVLDALTYAGNLSSVESALGPEVRFVHGHIEDTALVESLLRDETVDTIVHFAAESHVDRSVAGPDEFIQTNVLGTHSLLKAARKVWLDERRAPAHRFHHVSTDEVYGSLGPSDPAFTEQTPYSPSSPYSASKAGSDHLVRAYQHTYRLDTTISNCSNNYGPYQHPEKLMPLMIINALNGRALPVYGDGLNVRDWLYVEDHCRAIDAILKSGRSGETYNVGGNCERSNRQVLAALCAAIDQRFNESPALRQRFPQALAAAGKQTAAAIKFVQDRPGHDRRYAIDATKITSELKFSPASDFEQSIGRTVDWYLSNSAWWLEILRREGQKNHHWLPEAAIQH